LETEVRKRLRASRIVEDVAMGAFASLAEHTRYAAVLSIDTIDLLVKAAPLHDIGKVGIADHILNKPGPLDADEWHVMKQHTVIGANSIEHAMIGEADHTPLAFLHVAMEIARSHHEKWDGSGYPDGLLGEAIPLSARLMALADVFAALISRRVYKAAFSYEEASRIILAGRGSHFEPVLVDIFAARFDDFLAIARRYADEQNST